MRGQSGQGDCPVVLQPPLWLVSLLFHPLGISMTTPSGLGDPAVTGHTFGWMVLRAVYAAGRKQPADPWALTSATNNSVPCRGPGSFL